MNKHDIEDILDDLRTEVQEMRENGETDLRSVLHAIDQAISKVQKGNE